MARPAGFAKQYSGAAFTWWALTRDSAGMVIGMVARWPFWAVSCRWVWQAVALCDTASCVGATKRTRSVPHSARGGPARSGPDVYTSHRPELTPDAMIRGGRGGCLALTVLVSGCRRASWTAVGPERPRQPAVSAPSENNATRTTVRRNRYCRADGRRSPGSAPGRRGTLRLRRESTAALFVPGWDNSRTRTPFLPCRDIRR